MSIERHIFDVEYADDPALPRIYRTRVIMADRIAAEGRGRKYGLTDPREQPQLVGALWLWFSSVREGHIPAETSFEEFQSRALENTKVGSEPVPPTGASVAPSSPSPESSPESPSTDGPTTG